MNDNEFPENNLSPEESNKPEEGNITPLIQPTTAAIFGLIAVFILYQVGGSLLTLLVVGFDIEHADVNSLRLMTMAGQILLILLPTLLFTKFVYKDVSSIIRAHKTSFKEIGLFLLGLIILTPLLQEILFIQKYLLDILAANNAVFEKLKNILEELDKIIEGTYGTMLSANSILEGVLVVMVVAVTPAFCEEIFFRGFVQKSFELNLKPFWAVLITSVFFGMYHFNPFGLVALIALGMYLGYSVYLSNSILVPISIHFFNNFIAVIAYFIYGNEDLTDIEVVEGMGLGGHLITLLIMALIFAAFIYFLNTYYARVKPKEAYNDLS